VLIKSPVIASGSGSVAGLTLAHNRAGLYFRGRSIPVNPSSTYQVAIRAIFGNLSTAWGGTLTAAQRAAWETYAANVPIIGKLGDTLYLTGQQMYIRCNSARMQAGLSRIDDGPVTLSMDALSPVDVAATASSDALAVQFDTGDGWVDEDNAALLVYNSDMRPTSITYHKGPYRLAGKIDGDSVTPPTSPDTSLTSPFDLTTSGVFFARVLSVRADGRISPVQFIGPIPPG
jgi:hypothetical protein